MRKAFVYYKNFIINSYVNGFWRCFFLQFCFKEILPSLCAYSWFRVLSNYVILYIKKSTYTLYSQNFILKTLESYYYIYRQFYPFLLVHALIIIATRLLKLYTPLFIKGIYLGKRVYVFIYKSSLSKHLSTKNSRHIYSNNLGENIHYVRYLKISREFIRYSFYRNVTYFLYIKYQFLFLAVFCTRQIIIKRNQNIKKTTLHRIRGINYK